MADLSETLIADLSAQGIDVEMWRRDIEGMKQSHFGDVTQLEGDRMVLCSQMPPGLSGVSLFFTSLFLFVSPNFLL